MNTIGKRPEILLLMKLIQTDGTLSPFKKTSTTLVSAHSDGVYHRFYKADIFDHHIGYDLSGCCWSLGLETSWRCFDCSSTLR
ncbi:hypothetical protein AAC387_Pa01g3051 [Persea americana]